MYRLLPILGLVLANTTWRVENNMTTLNGAPYPIQGANFHGIESDSHAPLGLFDKPLSFFLDFLQEQGFNSLRLPLPFEAMSDLDGYLVQDCVGAEPSLHAGMPVSQLIQRILDETTARNISVLVDLHTVGGVITEKPRTDQVSEDRVVSAWVSFMQRFGSQVFAAELKNEPHGSVTLDEFFQHCALVAEAITLHAPEFQGLFFISGVQANGSAWGGSYDRNTLQSASFRGIKHPNVLCTGNISVDRIVLCPHIHGTSVRGEGARSEGETVWEDTYGFLTTLDNHWGNTSALVVSEYGGFFQDSDLDFYERWLTWMQSKGFRAGGYVWATTPFSRDTGGLFTESYDVRWDKVEYAKRLAHF
jgi:endoglucanase